MLEFNGQNDNLVQWMNQESADRNRLVHDQLVRTGHGPEKNEKSRTTSDQDQKI